MQHCAREPPVHVQWVRTPMAEWRSKSRQMSTTWICGPSSSSESSVIRQKRRFSCRPAACSSSLRESEECKTWRSGPMIVR